MLNILIDDQIAQKHLSTQFKSLDVTSAEQDEQVLLCLKDYYKARSLIQNDSMWLQYEHLGLRATREYKQVKLAARKLKDALKKYNTQRKRTKSNTEETSSESEEI